jgi:hypothetical protein
MSGGSAARISPEFDDEDEETNRLFESAQSWWPDEA